MLQGRRILLGITGGIAAYKIAFLIRILKKSGAEVKCIMTPASSHFISPLVVSTLSNNPVAIEFWNKKDGSWNSHVDLGLWADLFVVAPLTLNTLSKMVSGSCDNVLLATYFSMRAKTIVAPAMDLDMFAHPSCQRNLEVLKKDGVLILEPDSGELASGLEGQGRMPEPEHIFEVIKDYFAKKDVEQFAGGLKGKKVLITAGPTFEAIDPVRFIGNHSSGKMGYALAEKALLLGAEVTLVSGPVSLSLSHPKLNLLRVNSASEMLTAVKSAWSTSDLGLFCAAVADYRPENPLPEKMKKHASELTIKLVKNPDILEWAGSVKSESQFLVGFALETENVLTHAEEKCARKNLDAIVLNNLKDQGAGFAHDTNKISIFDKHNKWTHFELKHKDQVAIDILTHYLTCIS